jgi:hypothetical protein
MKYPGKIIILVLLLCANSLLAQIDESHYYSMERDNSNELMVVGNGYKLLIGSKTIRLLNISNLHVDTFGIKSSIQNVIVVSPKTISVSGIMESYLLEINNSKFEIAKELKYGPEYGYPFLTMLPDGYLAFSNQKNGALNYNIVYLPDAAGKPNPQKAKELLPLTKKKKMKSEFLPTRFQLFKGEIVVNVPTQGYAILYNPITHHTTMLHYLKQDVEGFIFSDLESEKLYYCAYDENGTSVYQLFTNKLVLQTPYRVHSINGGKAICKKTKTNEYHYFKL